MQYKTAGNIFKILLVVAALSIILSGISYGAEVDGSKQVNINQATVKELSALPGIGKKRAEAIIAYRQEKGKFESIDDVRKVEGIGKDTLEKIREHIVLE